MRVEDAKRKVCVHLSLALGRMEFCKANDCMEWQNQEEVEVENGYMMGKPIMVNTVVDSDKETENGYCKRIGK